MEIEQTDQGRIEADRALLAIENDALGVAHLARRIAASVVNLPPQDSLVIGLYGVWGTGKTTFINFVKQAIANEEPESRPLILDFNPWLVAGRDDLIQRYLVELAKALSPKKEATKKWGLKVFKFADTTTSISEQLLVFAGSLQANPLITGAAKAFGWFARKALRQLSQQAPLGTQKAKIENLLRKRTTKILVVIDDIDRLDRDEVLDIFRMVKAVADFPNVLYLLSFDRLFVSNVIGQVENTDGVSYLEKIIQYEIDIPQPDTSGLLNLFSERVDPVIEATGSKKWDHNRWSNIYRDYFSYRLRTPRQAIRLGNAIRIGYPSLIGEIDPVDFIAIEALRMFDPSVYYEVRGNRYKFTELGQEELGAKESDGPFFEKVMNSVNEKDQEPIKSLLTELFPRFERLEGNLSSSTDDLSSWRAQGRVCSSNHFGRYFSYGVSPNQFSDADITDAIKLTSDIAAFRDLIAGYSREISPQGKSRVPEFLQNFLDIVKAGQADSHLKDIVRDFLILGDLIIREDDEDRTTGLFSIRTELRIAWVIDSALRRLAEKESVFLVVQQAIQASESVYVPLRFLTYLGREHGKYTDKPAESIRSGQEPYISIEQLEELEAIVLSKVREAASGESMLENPELHSLLYRWRDVTGDIEEPKAWARKVATSDDCLKKLLYRLSGVTLISGMEGTIEKIRLKAEDVAAFLDVEEAYGRVKPMLKNTTLTDKERSILKAFTTSYENKKEGKSDDWD